MGRAPSLPIPDASPAPRGVSGSLALDWNHDFKLDLVTAGASGVRLFIQAADGVFADDTPRA